MTNLIEKNINNLQTVAVDFRIWQIKYGLFAMNILLQAGLWIMVKLSTGRDIQL